MPPEKLSSYHPCDKDLSSGTPVSVGGSLPRPEQRIRRGRRRSRNCMDYRRRDRERQTGRTGPTKGTREQGTEGTRRRTSHRWTAIPLLISDAGSLRGFGRGGSGRRCCCCGRGGHSGLGVIGIDNRLGDVHGRACPEHRRRLILLLGAVEDERVSVVGSILGQRLADLAPTRLKASWTACSYSFWSSSARRCACFFLLSMACAPESPARPR